MVGKREYRADDDDTLAERSCERPFLALLTSVRTKVMRRPTLRARPGLSSMKSHTLSKPNAGMQVGHH